MPRTIRRLLLALSIVIVAVAIVIWIDPQAAWLAVIVALAGAGIIAVLVIRSDGAETKGPLEPSNIDLVGEERRRELMRGTSQYLLQQDYRYSVRATRDDQRRCFTAEVNTVKLGFVPAIVTDTTTDRQGYGYVAFVYDGHRWRGPGLPCPDGQAEAVRHAARCVSPLATEEETSISET